MISFSEKELENLEKQLNEVRDGKLIPSPGWGVISRLLETIKLLKTDKNEKTLKMEVLDE